MSSKQLFIKIDNPLATEYYNNLKVNHDGDSGIDLYILEDVVFRLFLKVVVLVATTPSKAEILIINKII